MGDRDGATYRWVPNLLVNARPAVWLGVSKLIRSRGRAPSARHCLHGHLGHENTPAGAKMLKKCDFGVQMHVQRPEGSRAGFRNTQNFFGAIASVKTSPLLQGQARICRFLLLCSILVHSRQKWTFREGTVRILVDFSQKDRAPSLLKTPCQLFGPSVRSKTPKNANFGDLAGLCGPREQPKRPENAISNRGDGPFWPYGVFNKDAAFYIAPFWPDTDGECGFSKRI